MEKTLTVFTPTYNRAYCLGKGYEALKRQTCFDFKWLIIDDGSTDSTGELVKGWMEQKDKFEIIYIHKENRGLYSGYTEAMKYIDTELCVCVDSDDYLTDDAVETILSLWNRSDKTKYAGILGLDCYETGVVIGDKFPEQEAINMIDIMCGKYHFKNGDRKVVVRTELYKNAIPFDFIEGEKDFNPQFLHIVISKQYDFLVLNHKLCVVEYQPEGMSHTIMKQYERSPRSFRLMRLLDMSLPDIPLKRLLKTNIHYVSSCLLSGEPCISASNHKIITLLMWPFGLLFTVYIKLSNFLNK